MANIVQGRVVFDRLKFIDLPQGEVARYLLRTGDLLFNRTNSAELVGKTAIYDDHRRAVFASYLIRFRVRAEIADPHFVCAFINSSSGRAYIERNMARAIGQVNISASPMRKMIVPVPSLAEQQRLVSRWKEHREVSQSMMGRIQSQLSSLNRLGGNLLARAFAGPR